jgi:hypothetical protein
MQANSPCRSVTADEIAHYQEFGWVKLPGFVARPVVEAVLAVAKAKMGQDGDGNAPTEKGTDFFNPEAAFGMTNPKIAPLLHEIGRNADALMARRNSKGMRYFADYFAIKLPAGEDHDHLGSGRTDCHQDFVSWALDRTGGMTFWIALTDLVPESGTMSFLSHSHRLGTLGYFTSYGEGGLLGEFPEILDTCEIVEPMTYAAGDVTVHSSLCVHDAGCNLTADPRWAYLIIVNPADVRWTGGYADFFDFSGLEPFGAVDDRRYPILWSPTENSDRPG